MGHLLREAGREKSGCRIIAAIDSPPSVGHDVSRETWRVRYLARQSVFHVKHSRAKRRRPRFRGAFPLLFSASHVSRETWSQIWLRMYVATFSLSIPRSRCRVSKPAFGTLLASSM